jgi:hypothetical protein
VTFHLLHPWFDFAAAARRASRFFRRHASGPSLSGSEEPAEGQDSGKQFSPPAGPSRIRKGNPIRALGRYSLAALTIPDPSNGIIPPAVVRALTLHRKLGVDGLYASAPPFSVHVAAHWIHRLSGIPWIAEYRDPWSPESDEDRIRSKMKIRVSRFLRARTVRSAARHVTNADGQKEWLSSFLPPERARGIIVAKNGIAEILETPVQKDAGPFRVLYPGTLYRDRSPEPFFRALGRVASELNLGPEALEVVFLGLTYDDTERFVARVARDCGVDHLVRFMDWVPGSESRRLVNEADCLLLLAKGWLRQIPNKLFDYLGSRNPIVAYVDLGAGGEPERILRRVGGHLIVDSQEVDEVAAFLRGLLLDPDRRRVPRGRDDVLHSLSTDRQMTLLLDDLDPGRRGSRNAGAVPASSS